MAFERRASLPAGPKPIELQTDGRLIVGLGAENVLETGIQLHHSFGMPIIPGSALKGLVAHYGGQVWGATDRKFKKPTKEDDEAYRNYLRGEAKKPEDSFHRILFGNTDDSGGIVFHDAWYDPKSQQPPLVLDVMTPHHPKWIDGSAPPTDFDAPKPVPAQLPKSGDKIGAVLLEEKTKKNGWKAKHEPSGLSGPIQNTHDISSEMKSGDNLTLIVASANERQIAFRFPTAADEQRARKVKSRQKRRSTS